MHTGLSVDFKLPVLRRYAQTCAGRTPPRSPSVPAGYMDMSMSTRWQEICTSLLESKKVRCVMSKDERAVSDTAD